MAKQRCPVCGATQKDDAKACRMCGYRLGENIGSLVTQKAGTDPMISPKGGFGRPLVVALIGVVVVAVAAVGLRFIDADTSTVSDIRDAVPALEQEGPDGWTTFTAPSGEFSMEFPTVSEEASVAVPGVDGEVVGYEATAGDVELFVGRGTLPSSGAEPYEQLEALAAAYYGVDPDKVDSSKRIGVQGLPAVLTQEELEAEPGLYLTHNNVFILDGDTLYMVESRSPEDPAVLTTDPPEQFERVLGTLTITTPAG